MVFVSAVEPKGDFPEKGSRYVESSVVSGDNFAPLFRYSSIEYLFYLFVEEVSFDILSLFIVVFQ